METIFQNKKKREVDEVLEFLESLSEEEKKNFKIFMDGVKFIKKNEYLEQHNKKK